MPVEIRELIVRAVVNDTRERREIESDRDRKDNVDTETIVQECVRQVLRILKKSGER